MMTEEEIKSALRTGIHVVRFTKSDGSIREMKCTTCSVHLPILSEEEKANKQPSKPPAAGQIRAFDVDISEWRSFNYKTVLTFV